MVELIRDKEPLVKLDIRVIMETNTFQFLDILLSSLVKLEVERYIGEYWVARYKYGDDTDFLYQIDTFY